MIKFIIFLIFINYYCACTKNINSSSSATIDDHDIYLKKYQYNHNNKNHSTYRILLKRNAFYSKQYPTDRNFSVNSDERPAKNQSTVLNQLPRPHLRWSPPKIKMSFVARNYQCYNWLSAECQSKTYEYRDIIVNQLHNVNTNFTANNSNINNEDEINLYNVTYNGGAGSVLNSKTPVCAILGAGVKEIRKKDLRDNVLSDFILSKRMFNKNVKYKSCAIISSAGSILNSKLGSFIVPSMVGVENIIPLGNEAFRCYAFWSAILVAKMLVMSALTGRFRLFKKVFANPEDLVLRKQSKLVLDDPDVERVRRAHRNDLENILPFIIIGYFYLLTSPSKFIAINLFRAVGIARIVHTFVYAVVVIPQPSRAIAWWIGYSATWFMAVKTILYFL